MKKAQIIKTSIKLFVIAAVSAVGIISLGSARTYASLGSTGSAGPRALYVQNCAKCHGADGRADTPKGREVDADDLTSSATKRASTAKLLRVITKGKGDMPSFAKKLTAEQIRQISRYIRTL
ncbi:MAG TPA: cytochrome c [Pyrinomonadaceae bacterium]|nr:cytochrome c [Chloracidobacterium sp.]MBP9108022.1 cytochrome c [Pyrinomonadaceae bacterium]MBK9765695.1 cytochrome c [Chloracidobacterium sp.]MBL0242278.1 cytochrome c [Chloracidobacterium sp.]HQX56143.1 cytochrome c [Pyrinomonadaceae bacterium]